MPGSGNGRVIPFQSPRIRPRTLVTARKAGCLVSRSFLPAVRNRPLASKASAASAFCSAESVLRQPSQTEADADGGHRRAELARRGRPSAAGEVVESHGHGQMALRETVLLGESGRVDGGHGQGNEVVPGQQRRPVGRRSRPRPTPCPGSRSGSAAASKSRYRACCTASTIVASSAMGEFSRRSHRIAAP